MRWLTNARTNDVNSYICELTCGHEGKRRLVTGMPKESATYSTDELLGMSVFGIYEVSPCACAFCTEQRRRKHTKHIAEWRLWNAQNNREQQEGHR